MYRSNELLLKYQKEQVDRIKAESKQKDKLLKESEARLKEHERVKSDMTADAAEVNRKYESVMSKNKELKDNVKELTARYREVDDTIRELRIQLENAEKESDKIKEKKGSFLSRSVVYAQTVMDRTPKEMANRLGEIYRNIHEFITYAKSEKHKNETDEYDMGIFCVLRDLLKAYYSLMETKFKNNKVINEFLDEEFLRILPAVREKFLTFSNTLYAFCRDMFTLDPPPKFEFGDGIKGSKIDTELFTCYKRQGEIVDCVLWPALVSRSDDSVYEKGIVKAQVLETNSELQDKLTALRMKLANTEKERDQFLEERNAALTRQSAHAGKRLRDIDAAVLDLSPISLGEKFSELYENQWTDALEAIEALNISEVEGIKRLYAIVMLIYEECRIHSETQMDSLKKVMGLDGTDGDAMKKLRDFRKSVAGQYIVTVKKDVISCEAMRQRHEEKSHCMDYINRCIELCWFMQVQDPLVVLDFTMKPGMEIDEKIYRFFTKTGRIVDFVVWPVMMLHNNGPLLQKGVVQPRK